VSTLGILASGRGSNCESILAASAEGRLDAGVALVLSDRADAPVLARAEAHGVPARYLDPGRKGARLTPEAEAAYVQALRDSGVEWIALAGFMRIVGKGLLGAYPDRILNIHPSLLPAFPGLDAQKQAFDYGVKVAGCTVHFVNEGVDTGPIVLQEVVPVMPADTVDALSARILEREHALYVEALNLVMSGNYRLDGRTVLPLGDRK
jgi:phosphoribosylglycinamide formyltransferase-1